MKDINFGGLIAIFFMMMIFEFSPPFIVMGLFAYIMYGQYTASKEQEEEQRRNRRQERNGRPYDRRAARDYRNRRPADVDAPRSRRDYQRPAAKSTPRPKNNPFRASGIQKYKDFDYGGAIVDFEKALGINPKDVAVHFNLACAHSLMEAKDKAFYHLDRAVALGFTDFEKIKTHDALAYMRIQDEYDEFLKNGFRLGQQGAATGTSSSTASPQENQNLLEQLKKLGELREQGLLTEEEFVTQKKRLLQ